MIRHILFPVILILSVLSCRAAPTLEVIRQSLIKWEGYRANPYRDPVSKSWCVGIGHNITGHRETIRKSYTVAQLEHYFYHDVSEAFDACRAAIKGFDELPDQVQLVGLHLAFTCGRTGLMKFINLRRALGYRAYNGAAAELFHSKWFTQVAPSRASWAYNTLFNQS